MPIAKQTEVGDVGAKKGKPRSERKTKEERKVRKDSMQKKSGFARQGKPIGQKKE